MPGETIQPHVLEALPYCGGASCEAEVSRAVGVLAGRWAVAVIEALHFAGEAVRFKELQRRIARISPKELTRQLVHLQACGVVAQAEGGAMRGYRLTAEGQALMRHLEALGEWAKQVGGPPQAPSPDRPADWLGPLKPVSVGRSR
jgi:DNA-binding HxlR family transcriptional regulator